MGTYTIQRGDCLSSIAKQHGFYDPLTIWSRPENASLRRRRPDMNVLQPGDALFIPDKMRGSLDAPVDASHRFRIRRQRVLLELVLRVDGEPLADTPYVLELASGPREGRTDGDGRVREPIEPDEASAVLRIADPDIEWQLQLGHLDPVTEVAGVQERLRNLGHPCGAIDGQTGPRVRAALRQFQARHGLKPSGAIDGATTAALTSLHDRAGSG